jgi:hypothetical protein
LARSERPGSKRLFFNQNLTFLVSGDHSHNDFCVCSATLSGRDKGNRRVRRNIPMEYADVYGSVAPLAGGSVPRMPGTVVTAQARAGNGHVGRQTRSFSANVAKE